MINRGSAFNSSSDCSTIVAANLTLLTNNESSTEVPP